MPDHVYVTIDRVAREALGVAREHPGSGHVSLELGQHGDDVVLSIGDDHPWPDHDRWAHALVSVRDRVSLVGGWAELVEPPRGILLRVSIPVERQAPSPTSIGSSSTNTEPNGSPAR